MLDSVLAEVKELEAEQREGQAAMAKLKGSLYERFGDAINLED